MGDILKVAPADVDAVRALGGGDVEIAVVLGSGLARVATGIQDVTVVPYDALPGFPKVGNVAGHLGKLAVGTLGGKQCAVFLGRVHTYQGASALEAAYPVRLASALGASIVILTNASGALDPDLVPGNLVLVCDHINVDGVTPLAGWTPDDAVPFVGMHDAYDFALARVAYEAASEAQVRLREGIYAFVPGPQYETASEAAMLRKLGGDIVGMSTVPEVIAARALGQRVLALSFVANVAGAPGLDHAEVLEVAERASGDLSRVLLAILSRL